jgi:hypothetical protein
MKALVILLYVLLAALGCNGQTPNTKEWLSQKKTQKSYLLKQIVALEVYYNYLKKGYEVVDKGLTLVGDIKDNAFQSDKSYLQYLGNPSPVIRNSPKLAAIIGYRNDITSSLERLVKDCRATDLFTTEEVTYIEKVYKNMISECAITMSEFSMVADQGQTEMTDDERIARLDKVYVLMQDRHTFTKSFCSDTRAVGGGRAKTKHDIEISKTWLGL